MVPTTEVIGGRSIIIVRCSAEEALDLELAIAKTMGGGDTSSLMLAMDGDLREAIASGLVQMLANVARNLTLVELKRLMGVVFKYTTIEGKPFKSINEDFADRPLDTWQVFMACLKHNLGPLVEGLPQKPDTNQTKTT